MVYYSSIENITGWLGDEKMIELGAVIGMSNNEKLHFNNAESDNGLLSVQKGLPEERKIAVDVKLNLMNREKQGL